MKLFLILPIMVLSLALWAKQADDVRQNFSQNQQQSIEAFEKAEQELNDELSSYRSLQGDYDTLERERSSHITSTNNRLGEELYEDIQKYKTDGAFKGGNIVDIGYDEGKDPKQLFTDTKDTAFTAIDQKIEGLEKLERSDYLKKMQNPPSEWPTAMKEQAKENAELILAGIRDKKNKFNSFKDKWKWSPNLFTSKYDAIGKMKEFLEDFEGPRGPLYTMRQADTVWDVAARTAQEVLQNGTVVARTLEGEIVAKYGNDGVGGTERAKLLESKVDNFENAIKNSLLSGRYNKLEAKFILQDLDSWARDMGMATDRAALKELLVNDKEFNKQMANTPLGVYVNGQISKATAMIKDDMCNAITQCSEANETVFGKMFKFLDSSKREGEEVKVDPNAVQSRAVEEN